MLPLVRQGGIFLAAAVTLLMLAGCSGKDVEPVPSPQTASPESVAAALARGQESRDTPPDVDLDAIEPRSVRLIATVGPASWYVGRSTEGDEICALGVYHVAGGSVSDSRCVPNDAFDAGGITTFIGTADDQSHVWLVPSTTTPPAGSDGWVAIGPSVLVPGT